MALGISLSSSAPRRGVTSAEELFAVLKDDRARCFAFLTVPPPPIPDARLFGRFSVSGPGACLLTEIPGGPSSAPHPLPFLESEEMSFLPRIEKLSRPARAVRIAS